MLRASSQADGTQADLDSLVGRGGDGGINAGTQLINYAEVGLGDDAQAIAAAREAVQSALGEAAMVDAAGVVANFQRMVRIADSTGIPLDEPVMMMTQDIREDLGINEYAAHERSPALSFGKKLLGRVLRPFMNVLLKRVAQSRS